MTVANYARVRLVLHLEVCEAPEDSPMDSDPVLHNVHYEEVGRAMNMLELMEDLPENLTQMLGKILLNDKMCMDDCEAFARIRDVANELIPEGC